MAEKQKLVIVGNGMATGRLLDEMSVLGCDHLDITVIGDEPEGSYNRIMLSPVLAQEASLASIIQKPVQWFEQNAIGFVGGERVVEIDRQQRYVVTEGGRRFCYDQLVLATGSRPARIPAKNQKLRNIFSFRTIADVEQISASAEAILAKTNRPELKADALSSNSEANIYRTQALVVGGGLLGLEAAYGLARRGIEVVLVHRSPWLLNRQLDEGSAAMLNKVLSEKGIKFELGSELEEFFDEEGEGCLTGFRLSNGRFYLSRLAVIATGITPNKELGEEAGLDVNRGVLVDEYLRSSDASISALGECVECQGQTFGLVEPIWQHCTTLAQRLCKGELIPFVSTAVATKLKVSGVQVFSAGQHIATAGQRELKLVNESKNIYRKLILENGKIKGVVLFGDTRDGQDYFTKLMEQQDVSHITDLILLGKAFYKDKDANKPLPNIEAKVEFNVG